MAPEGLHYTNAEVSITQHRLFDLAVLLSHHFLTPPVARSTSPNSTSSLENSSLDQVAGAFTSDGHELSLSLSAGIRWTLDEVPVPDTAFSAFPATGHRFSDLTEHCWSMASLPFTQAAVDSAPASMRCLSLASLLPIEPTFAPRPLPPTPPRPRPSPRRRKSTPAPVLTTPASAPPPPVFSPTRPHPPLSAGNERRTASSATTPNGHGDSPVVIVPLRRRRSVDTGRLADSRLINARSNSMDPPPRRLATTLREQAKRKDSSLPRASGEDIPPFRMDDVISEKQHDVFSTSFGSSSTSLASRAPTFVSSRSAFTDESSLHTPDNAYPEVGHLGTRDMPPLPSPPMSIRSSVPRRRSSTGFLRQDDTAASPPSTTVVSSSVPARRAAAHSVGQAAPFSNLVAVEPSSRRPLRARENSRNIQGEERAVPLASHMVIQVEGPPPQKLKRKASLVVRGKYGGDASSSSEALPARPRVTAKNSSTQSAPVAVPRRSSSGPRPSLSASRPAASLDALPISLPPLPPLPSHPSGSRAHSRGRSKTKGAADEASSRSSTLRGSLLKLRKSTASLRSAFRSRSDTPPPSPPPLPPPPVLHPRPPLARESSIGPFLAALQAEAVEGANLRRRASSRSPAGPIRRATQSGREGSRVDAFAFAPTTIFYLLHTPLDLHPSQRLPLLNFYVDIYVKAQHLPPSNRFFRFSPFYGGRCVEIEKSRKCGAGQDSETAATCTATGKKGGTEGDDGGCSCGEMRCS
ncbi:hypothetical protein JCM11641_007967 [Rhodosporidiobolus odoratus]